MTGTLQQRKQLTATPGTWSGAGRSRYAYQWYRCDSAGAHCKSISGATKATYTQGTRDVGQTLGLAVHADGHDRDGDGVQRSGRPRRGSSAKLVASAPPAITGTPSVGGKLEVAGGSWSLTPTAFTYQWQRCNVNGRLCAAIPGAVGSSYSPTAGDVGYRLLAVVQAVANGLPQATLSTTTAPVA